MLIEAVSFLGSIASISGVSLATIFRARNDHAKVEKLFHQLTAVLVDLEEGNDPLVGYWQLRNWDFTSAALPPYVVSGGLGIHRRDREASAWKGVMCLEYNESPRGEPVRQKGDPPPFIASYEVAFTSSDRQVFSGSCHMLERVDLDTLPKRILRRVSLKQKRPYRWRGEFVGCEIAHSGSGRQFTGRYLNYPRATRPAGEADFVFHLPTRWGAVRWNQFAQRAI